MLVMLSLTAEKKDFGIENGGERERVVVNTSMC